MRVFLRSPAKLALIALNLVVYYLLLRWFVGNIHLGKMIDYLEQISIWAIIGSLSINMMALGLYGVRMMLLLNRNFYTAFSIVNIGYALNTLIPLRIGDVMKMYLGHKYYEVPLIGIFSASVAEKLVDLFKLLLLGIVVVVFTASQMIQTSLLFSVAILVLLGATAFTIFRLYIVRIIKLLPRKSRLRRISIEMHKHASSYQIKQIMGISLAIWLLNVVLVFFTFNTYLIGINISLLDAATLLLILSFAIAIPSAPAGIGLFEAAIVAYLTQFSGVSNEAALAAAVVFHVIITVPQLLITAWLLLSRNRTLYDVS